MNLIQRTTKSLLCGAGFVLAALAAGCGGGDQGRDPILGLPVAELVSVSVTPASATVLAGATQQFNATASYSDGSSRNVTASSAWVSATPAIATVGAATGLATGVAAGSAALSATFGAKSGSATLAVTAPVAAPVATLTSIAVTPANASVSVGASQQFVAIGTYSDNSTAVITNAVSWASGTTSIGTIAASGAATGSAAGTTLISATSGVQSGTAVLTVSAPVVVAPPVVTPPATAINLGGAASFAVLAGTSITNNSGGTTLVTGDVGAPSQTTDPVQVAGFANYKSGAILSGALADLQTAITDANSRTCTVTSAAGIDLGGLVLTPGVYCYAGAISITGTFTMNGPGVYIFRTASTLNTTANSIVALSGGATAENVTWVPVGPTTLGANSVFKGSILGQSAAITMGDNATLLNGRVLTAAAVTLRNNQISK
jgi:hypothetical protein